MTEKKFKAQQKKFLDYQEKNPLDLEAVHRYADWLFEQGKDELGFQVSSVTQEALNAKQWMKDFAAACHLSFDEVMQAGYDWVLTEPELRGYYFPDIDAPAASELLERNDNKEKYWENWQLITQLEVDPELRADPFICGC